MRTEKLNKKTSKADIKNKAKKRNLLSEDDLELVIGGVRSGGFLQGGFISK